jgi:hypothetical protein
MITIKGGLLWELEELTDYILKDKIRYHTIIGIVILVG